MELPIRRAVRAGVQSLPPGLDLPRHQHLSSYVTLVLEGAFQQIGYAGRLQPRAGDLLVQPTLDCHANRMRSEGLTLMRLPWRHEASLGGVWRGLDLDLIRREGERDAWGGSALVSELIAGRAPEPPVQDHWVDELAARLAADPQQPLAAWACSTGRTREAASRAFHGEYGASPSAFRLELRTRDAWLRIVGSAQPLSQIALDLGFADQPHMTRAVRWLTDAAPGAWRRGRTPAAMDVSPPGPAAP
jgi:AraC-like DNA-binding protein